VPIPSKRAFFATFATSVWTQVLTLITGALTARLLGPEGRGQFAGAQVWPMIIGVVALVGANSSLSLLVAKEREKKGAFEWQALSLGLPLSILGAVIGWVAMPLLVPTDNPDLLWLSRVNLIYIPLYVLTAFLMAIDQGCGDFRRFNIARNILAPVYLVLLVAIWMSGLRDVIWFIYALLAANLAVLAYRVAVIRWDQIGDHATAPSRLFQTGISFWITGIVGILRENAARLLLMFLLGPASLGLFVVAFTASAAHLNVSKSLNLIIFSRSAALQGEHALQDAARFFRLMGIVNFVLSMLMVAAMPVLIWIIYGSKFSESVIPAMMLLLAQYFLSQGGILDEALRGQGRPYVGLVGLIAGVAAFAALGWFLAKPYGLVGVAAASIGGQLIYWLWMMMAFRRIGDGIRLLPVLEDISELIRLFKEMKRGLMNRAIGKSAV
jgi:O-antigen/teichoic acid export membrane protein